MNNYSLAYIGLGSNLNDPVTQIARALDSLSRLPASQHLRCAPWYRSQAIGPAGQPDYINTVVSLETSLQPHDFLQQLQAIEHQQGRQRGVRWGARTLDLDLLLYDNICLHTEELHLPHPEMTHRHFVLQPLWDLAPTLTLPDGSAVTDHLKHCDSHELIRIEAALQAMPEELKETLMGMQ